MGNLTLAELEKMHERLEQAHLKYPDHSDIKKEVTNAIYGSVENMFDYLDWFCNKRQPIVYIPKPAIPTYKEFKSTITNVNFNNKDSVAHLSNILDLPAAPHVPIGTWKGIRFSLLPCADTLCGDGSDRYQVSDNDRILPESFLNVQIPDPPTQSISLPPSPPLTPPRALLQKEFVIYQLGMLEFYPPSSWNLDKEEHASDNWVDTGFVVFMKVNEDRT